MSFSGVLSRKRLFPAGAIDQKAGGGKKTLVRGVDEA
jgi:hypothetical protein